MVILSGAVLGFRNEPMCGVGQKKIGNTFDDILGVTLRLWRFLVGL